ncbi:SpoIID/LytB domain-containing protein, partial [bacterium]
MLNSMDARKKFLSVLVVLLTALYLTGWYHVPAGLAQVPEKIRIGIIVAKSAANNTSDYRDAGVVSFSVQGGYQIIDAAAFPGLDVIGTPAAGENWQVLYLTTGIQVMKDGESQKITTGPVVIREASQDTGNLVTLNSYTPNGGSEKTVNKKYRGNIEFRVAGGSVVAVNEVLLDEYIYGVVAREMSESWPAEALKAGAVAARSYVSANPNKHLNEGYNLCSGTHCQVYKGNNPSIPNVKAAVDATKGEVIVQPGQDRPLDAVYHSNSGGHTENNENVWGKTAAPHLRGKPDPYSLKNGAANWSYTTTIDDVSAKLNSFDAKFTDLASLN